MSVVLENVTFAYGNTVVCRELTWRLPERGVVCLWGPSGCGKTTLLRLLAGLERPAAGRVAGWRPPVAVCFQDDRLLPWRTVRENIVLPGGTDTAQADEVMRRLELTDYGHRYPAELSGGQQRRAALARALAAPGEMLLLDEPFTGLDEPAWRTIAHLIRERAEHQPVVLVTHAEEQAQALQARRIFLRGTPLTGVLEPE